MVQLFKFENKIGWAEIIAFLALIISSCASFQSYIVREDTKVIQKIDFRPQLTLRADFRKPGPYLLVTNNGPVSAVQLQVQIIGLQYFPDVDKIRAAFQDSASLWTVKKLEPFQKYRIQVNKSAVFLPEDFPNIEDRIVEVKLSYRREADLKQYTESAFYFYNPEGKLVSESDNSLVGLHYDSLKKAALKRFGVDSTVLDVSNILHEI